MYSDLYSDSDDEYEPSTGNYRWAQRPERPPLRLLEDEERYGKKSAYRCINRATMHEGRPLPPEREQMRAVCEQHAYSTDFNWHRVRILRFFKEMQGFHKGELDLSGRSWPRYEPLWRRWDAFHPELTDLIRAINRLPEQEDELWEEFRQGWKITAHYSLDDILDLARETSDVIAAHIDPIFQRKYLASFPPEILSEIYEHADLDAALALSSTSRYIRAVGLSRIFQCRAVAIHVPSESSLSKETELGHALQRSIEGAVSTIEFLLAQPVILQHMEILFLENYWNPQLPVGETPLDGELLNMESARYALLYTRVCELLSTLDLRKMMILDFLVTPALADKITEQPHLTELSSYYWNLSSNLPGHLGALTYSTTITFLRLSTWNNVEAEWCLVALCPALAQLYICNDCPSSGIPCPEPRFWPELRALNRIEHLHFQGIHPLVLGHFAQWFLYASSLGPLKLTHLKIGSRMGMPDMEVRALLSSLHAGHPPLRALVVEGIAKATPPLFETIGELFPDLEGLTIIARCGRRQMRNGLCQWDYPGHEYARSMRALTRLRHFGANFRMGLDDAVASPDYDRIDDDQICTADNINEHDRLQASASPRDYTLNMYGTLLPFAAYCQALETFANTDSVQRWRARIHRLPKGALSHFEFVKPGDFEVIDQEYVWHMFPPGTEDFVGWDPSPGETWDRSPVVQKIV
ncbi:hypothetical protein EXIGLDRAFT_836580 [Exidia glandulosa HHB12029]|uniref:F-box domain-containing protein n=1 Tax=Exidia glandulosa HHB12029 TaxID=1314781 RepID=A0A165HPY5_EXIGL|nr:hypothetical protein EXIGLDRAFT_836580 [Exidia glandulosa HHB12029]